LILSQLRFEGVVKEGLEKMLGLMLGFPLLRAQALEAPDNSSESFSER